MKKNTIISFLSFFLFACAYNSGVIPVGEGKYLITKQASTGFSGMGGLKARASEEANAFCLSKGKKSVVLGTKDAQPPYILGNFPRTEITFECR